MTVVEMYESLKTDLTSLRQYTEAYGSEVLRRDYADYYAAVTEGIKKKAYALFPYYAMLVDMGKITRPAGEVKNVSQRFMKEIRLNKTFVLAEAEKRMLEEFSFDTYVSAMGRREVLAMVRSACNYMNTKQVTGMDDPFGVEYLMADAVAKAERVRQLSGQEGYNEAWWNLHNELLELVPSLLYRERYMDMQEVEDAKYLGSLVKMTVQNEEHLRNTFYAAVNGFIQTGDISGFFREMSKGEFFSLQDTLYFLFTLKNLREKDGNMYAKTGVYACTVEQCKAYAESILPERDAFIQSISSGQQWKPKDGYYCYYIYWLGNDTNSKIA